MISRPGARPRHERAAVALVFTALLALYAWAARYRLDTLDEGYFVYTSSRTLVGELPYRDFSTPYTPAFFFLNALLFQVFGLDVATVRVSQAAARLAILLLVYLLGRRIMPPSFAALPSLVLLAEDQVPGNWLVHPAWWATTLFLCSVWAAWRYCEGGRTAWWLVAGLAAGAAFAFKQNVGLFALMALIGLVFVEYERLPAGAVPAAVLRAAAWGPIARLATALPRAAPAYLLLVAAAVGWLARAHISAMTVVQFVAPLGALAWQRVAAARLGPPCRKVHEERLAAAAFRLAVAIGAFLLVTVPWVAAFLVVLGPAETPLAAFVGAIDTSGYFLEIEALRPAIGPVIGLLLLSAATAWAVAHPWPRAVRLGVALAAGPLAAGLVASLVADAAAVHPSFPRAAALLSVHATTNLILYLPIASFWSGFALLAAGRVPRADRPVLRWLLLAGAFLYLTQYPRADEPHLVWSAPLLWLVGAYCLWRLWAWATRDLAPHRRRLRQATLYLALLGLPLAAVWPNLEQRRQELLTRRPGASATFGSPHTLVAVDLPGARVYEVEELARKYQQLNAYFALHSRPGERIFVFPAAPLLYILVDRPNGTRFNHLLPGLVSPRDEQEAIERLASVPVTWVIWDSFGENYWLERDDYQALRYRIWDAYEPVESIGGFEIMRRKGG